MLNLNIVSWYPIQFPRHNFYPVFTIACLSRYVHNLKHQSIYLSIYPVFFNSCRPLPETKFHSCLFLPWSGSKFLVVMAACTPSIHVFLGRPKTPVRTIFFKTPVWQKITDGLSSRIPCSVLSVDGKVKRNWPLSQSWLTEIWIKLRKKEWKNEWMN